MTKSKKTLYMIAGILSLLTAISSIAIMVIMLGFDTFTPYVIYEFLLDSGVEITLEAIESFYLATTIAAGISLILSTFIAFVSINASFKTQEQLNKMNGLLIATLFISWLFSNIIASILLTIAYFIKPETIVSNEQSQTQRERAITKEIESIRKLYQMGAITKEEYDRLVKELFNKIEFN